MFARFHYTWLKSFLQKQGKRSLQELFFVGLWSTFGRFIVLGFAFPKNQKVKVVCQSISSKTESLLLFTDCTLRFMFSEKRALIQSCLQPREKSECSSNL